MSFAAVLIWQCVIWVWLSPWGKMAQGGASPRKGGSFTGKDECFSIKRESGSLSPCAGGQRNVKNHNEWTCSVETALLRELGTWHQGVRRILVPTGGLCEFASALTAASQKPNVEKDLTWKWDRHTWSVPCLRLVFLLVLKAENISPSDFFFLFSSSSCNSRVLPSSVFRLWACNQQSQHGKITENDSSAQRRSLFVLWSSQNSIFVLVFPSPDLFAVV